MKKSLITLAVFLILVGILAPQFHLPAQPENAATELTLTPRQRMLFDFDWRFHRGALDAGYTTFLDDSDWRKLDLPHDWSIEDLPGTNSPLDPLAAGGIDHGYFVGGVGIYRKTFEVPKNWQGKRIHLQFDGVYMNADVWLNGRKLGTHHYGYTSFWYDISDQLQYGEKNILAVEVRNEGKNSRWYSGSGIYRHVWLDIMEPVHIAHWGTAITTPSVSQEIATVEVRNSLQNERAEPVQVLVKTSLFNPKGEKLTEVASKLDLPGLGQAEVFQSLQISQPNLWSPDSPDMYHAKTEIRENATAKPLDEVNTPFGIRSFSFDTEQGFVLNGQTTLLRGACVHHDNGPLGSAAYDRAEERRVALLKASGFNAIRCSHNPPSPAFLDACDRQGMLVIDEAFDTWNVGKQPFDYSLYFDKSWKKDLSSMIYRDRNHPSIIMWSTGNEIPNRASPAGVAVSAMLTEFVHQLDPTRPVTAAVNGLNPDKDPFFATLDLAGYNYAGGGDHGHADVYQMDHARVPDRIMYGAESYPLESFQSWVRVLDYPYVVGDFVWTGFDYLGEASIGWLGYPQDYSFYPWNTAFCGDIDICGFKRPQSYYRDVLWQKGQLISLFVKNPQLSFAEHPRRAGWSKWHWHDHLADWTWPGYEGQEMEVRVFSAYEEVALFLNGKSLGKKPTTRENRWTATYQVPYEPGVLKAQGYENGKATESWLLPTANKVQGIKLSADRTLIKADGQDLSYVTVDLVDKNGLRHPKADQLIQFELSGPGSIVAVANANPRTTESFQASKRKAFQGRALVIIKSTQKEGTIRLKAKSSRIEGAEISIETK
jgi:beta-galactosidase